MLVYCALIFSLFVAGINAIYVFDSKLPPRLQWLSNDGYCGEVSTVAAGLKYGQYFSQYDIRDIATGNQQKYYLIGFNDKQTSTSLRLSYIEFDSENNIGTEKYLSWIKSMTRRGYAITIGVYMNYYLFYGVTIPGAGEFDYDHIVSVSNIMSKYDDDEYHPEDIITISDHGLWAPRITGPVYLFNYTFSDFIGTREEANARNGNLYTLPKSSKLTTWNFGIAHTGIHDDNNDTLRVTIETNVNYEAPEIDNKSNQRPKSMPLLLTARIYGMVVDVSYNIYQYNDETIVPTSQFNEHANLANKIMTVKCCHTSEYGTFTDDGTTFLLATNILSNEKVIYRAVRTDAK